MLASAYLRKNECQEWMVTGMKENNVKKIYIHNGRVVVLGKLDPPVDLGGRLDGFARLVLRSVATHVRVVLLCGDAIVCYVFEGQLGHTAATATRSPAVVRVGITGHEVLRGEDHEGMV